MNNLVARIAFAAVATLLVVAQPSCSPVAQTSNSAQPPGAAKPAAAAPPADAEIALAAIRRLPTVESLLERRLSVHYRRAHLGEVLSDLHERVGLEIAFPKTLDERFTFDFTAKQVRVKEVLEKLAAAGGLELEFRDEIIVFWRREDPHVLRKLIQTVKNERSPQRCGALLELAQLGDKQIYPVLFWATAEASEPMALAAARSLAKDHSTTLRYGEDLDLFAKGLARLLASRPENERNMLIGLAEATHSPHARVPLLPLIDHPDANTREYAISVLAETRDPGAVKPLLGLLKKNFPEPPSGVGHRGSIRDTVIAALGRLGGPEAIRELRAMAKDEREPWQLLMLSGALAEAGDPHGVEMLLALLKENPPEADGAPADRKANSGGGGAGGMPLPVTLREAIVGSLGQTRDERAVEPLISVLKSPRAGEQVAAAAALGKLRDPRAVQPLVALLANRRLIAPAVTALEQIGDARATEPLAKLLDHESIHVRFATSLALVSLGDSRGQVALMTLLETDDEVTRFAAVRALAAIHAPEGVDALVKDLKHPEPRRRRDAADELARLRDLNTIKPLSELLLDPDENVSFAAAWAIGHMRDPKAVEQILPLLEDDNATRRTWGARVLQWTGETAATSALVRALKDSDDQVRQEAARALVAIGDPRALDAVLAMLSDPVRDVRRYTASALGAIREERVIRALQATLHDKDGFVREAAAHALVATHDPTAIRELALLATGENAPSEVRTSAARAFGPPSNPHVTGDRADPCVMDCLIQLMSNDDANVRASAAAALGSMEDNCAIDPLIAALDDPQAKVRETARQMLQWYPEAPKVKAALGE